MSAAAAPNVTDSSWFAFAPPNRGPRKIIGGDGSAGCTGNGASGTWNDGGGGDGGNGATFGANDGFSIHVKKCVQQVNIIEITEKKKKRSNATI